MVVMFGAIAPSGARSPASGGRAGSVGSRADCACPQLVAIAVAVATLAKTNPRAGVILRRL
jgi:hypothetical protein